MADRSYKLELELSSGERVNAGVFTVPQGDKGDKGDKGDTGTSVTVSNVTESNTDRGQNVVTFSDGKQVTILNGATGAKGETGEKGATGEQGVQGIQGVQGEKGEPFSIAKTYASVSEMNAGFATDGVVEGGFVLIVSNVEDEDNAKLYVKGADAYSFVVDLSGMTGIQGPQGIQGIQGVQGEKGETGEKGATGETGAQGIGVTGASVTLVE